MLLQEPKEANIHKIMCGLELMEFCYLPARNEHFLFLYNQDQDKSPFAANMQSKIKRINNYVKIYFYIHWIQIFSTFQPNNSTTTLQQHHYLHQYSQKHCTICFFLFCTQRTYVLYVCVPETYYAQFMNNRAYFP